MENGVQVFAYDEVFFGFQDKGQPSLEEFSAMGLEAICDGDSQTVTVGTPEEIEEWTVN